MRTILLAAAAALLPALAHAGAQGTIPVDPDRQVTGTFAAAGTQTWRLYLKQGRYYAVWASDDENAAVTVRAAGGRVLAAFPVGAESSPHGASFGAPYTGLYTVAITCGADCNPPNGYAISAGRDCPGDPSTRCGITVGQTLHDLQSRFLEDDDWFAATLRGGRSYRMNATRDPASQMDQTLLLAVRDARGRLLATDYGQGAPGRFLDFTAPVDGRYFVEVKPDGDEPVADYSLSLALSR